MVNDQNIHQMMNEAIWVAANLFSRGKTAGSSANLSFRYQHRVFISGSGTCFANLSPESFSEVDLQGNHLGGIKPSKELPLHLSMYNKEGQNGAVIHIHSFFATLWSCYCPEVSREASAIPKYTPYLEMKLGKIGLIPFAPPGSQALFDAFAGEVDERNGYLLRNHGPIVAGANLFEAFYAIEELEESARIAWELRNEKVPVIN